jgi:DNA invertase Pin-like site-specific DNA recombinase
MTLAGYARTSTKEQDISSQLAALKEAGVPADLIFFDEGISGMKAPEDRKGYKRLMKLIEAGGVEDLYVFELSRIGRDTISTLGELIRLEKAGITVHSLSPQEKILEETRKEFRPLLISALQIAAEIERVHISERTRAGLEMVRLHGSKSGKKPGGQPKPPNMNLIKGFMEKGLSERSAVLASGAKLSTYYRWKKKKQIDLSGGVR